MSQPTEGQDRLDYRETDDITEVHAPIAREHAEPRAGTMPIPTWLGVVCAGALAWASAYLGVFHGGFSSKVYNEDKSTPADIFDSKGSKSGPPPDVDVPLIAIGAKVFGQCAACHGANGAGMPPNPPLAGSEWVDGPEFSEKRLIAILLKGLKGPVSVKGATYNSAMPPWGQALKPREIAGVANYVRQSFGNKGTGEITEAQVVKAKKLFADKIGEWSIEEIKAIPLTDVLEGGAPAGDAKPVANAKPAGDAKPGDKPAVADAKPAVPAAGTPAVAAPAASTFDLASSIKSGQALYTVTCGQVCHQLTGVGIPGAFPTLIDTPYVKDNPRRLVAIALKGILGPINVKGVTFNSAMPPPDTTYPQLKIDKNVADVLNYVRNSWGNKSTEPVTPELVAAVRKEFAEKTAMWTEAELLNFPPAK